MLRAQKRPTSENGLRGGRKKSQAELSRAELTDCHRKSEEGARIRSGFTSFSWRASIYDIHTILGFLTPNHPLVPKIYIVCPQIWGFPDPLPLPSVHSDIIYGRTPAGWSDGPSTVGWRQYEAWLTLNRNGSVSWLY